MSSKLPYAPAKNKKAIAATPVIDKTPERQYGLTGTLRYVWLLIPFLLLFKTVAEYTYNIPKQDDYDAILKFINNFIEADGSTRLQLLFSQHNEHRIFTSRIVYLLQYYLTGSINFKGILYIGNLQLIPIFIVLAYFIKRFVQTMWLIPAFVASLCLFDLAGYDNSGFAMAAIQNYGVVMYFLLGLYFYHTDGKHNTWLAPLMQILCTFSSGNGIVGSMLIAASVLFTDNRTLKITSVATFIVFSGLYLAGFHGTEDPDAKVGALEQIIPFYLVEVGAHFGFENAKYAGGLILLLLGVFFPVSKKLKLDKNAVPLLAILFFALASLMASAIFRSGTGNMQWAYTSRYFIYNNIITAIVFCLIFARVYGKKAQWPVVIVAGIIILASYKHNYQYGISNYQLQEARLLTRQYYYPDNILEDAKRTAEKSCQLGVYCIEENREPYKPRN